VASIPVCFAADGAIDLSGLRRIVDRGIAEGGSTAAMLTYGDAHFEMLSPDEIRTVVETVVDAAAGRTAIVVATGLWSTRHAVEYAEFCRDSGVDAVQVTYALRWGAYDGNDVVAHHRAIARVLPIQLFGHSDASVHRALVDEPQAFGWKCESAADAFAMKSAFGDRYQVMMGGAHWAHQMTWALGVTSWMSFWCGLAPDVAVRYRDAFQRGDLPGALALVRDVELPFFSLSANYAGGLEAVWRATLALQGITLRYRRAPLLSLSDADLATLRQELAALGLPMAPAARRG
jgi:dihydrodipicolinate synthase/N-acetylneuraminate lyase